MRWFIARLLFYPTLAWNLMLHRLNRRRRWWDRIDRHVILGALPFASDVAGLAAEGVRAVVNTCEEYAGPLAAYGQAGIEQFHIPTVDFMPPRLEDVERAVAFIAAYATRGESVYVHCKAGRGRSATVVLCWLIQSQALTPQEAQRVLCEKRPHVMPYLYEREVVKEFAMRHGKFKADRP